MGKQLWDDCYAYQLNIFHYSALRKLVMTNKNAFIMSSMTIDYTDAQILHPLHPLLQNPKPIREGARLLPGLASEEKP